MLFFLLIEVQELEQNLPDSCKVTFANHDRLHEFSLTVTPDTGYWHGGVFTFEVSVPEEYNIVVSLRYQNDMYPTC